MPKIIESSPHKPRGFDEIEPRGREEIIQKKRSRIKILIFGFVALALLLAVVAGALWVVGYFKWPGFVYAKFFAEKPAKLWTVYLATGGQTTTYYGEIAKWKDDYIVLKNPAYIDVRQPQEGETEPVVTFRRLSDEFYKPKPEAKIFKQNIIFLQELANDSPIHEAYKQAPAR